MALTFEKTLENSAIGNSRFASNHEKSQKGRSDALPCGLQTDTPFGPAPTGSEDLGAFSRLADLRRLLCLWVTATNGAMDSPSQYSFCGDGCGVRSLADTGPRLGVIFGLSLRTEKRAWMRGSTKSTVSLYSAQPCACPKILSISLEWRSQVFRLGSTGQCLSTGKGLGPQRR